MSDEFDAPQYKRRVQDGGKACLTLATMDGLGMIGAIIDIGPRGSTAWAMTLEEAEQAASDLMELVAYMRKI